ncbi:carboxypeptidase B isoform X2 [Eurytemora carolleeae]|uniref:carboxypeptidase B isoform X1 n=1 Tax=Eurytemora carolleeae TaxID=1294199 RepID=UPI000C757548|nr:carboxypeptidase B isoform X1 [Eurytemora carolleeae]XP_023337444.1 carboxypeptidase B isoform X2 [Eurytemora carolleeae]|eukprot:XP_023337443.1 carboxypeptidase B-like isoform X1 [Eurytemora affinis]
MNRSLEMLFILFTAITVLQTVTGVDIFETERTLYNGFSVLRTEDTDEPLIEAIRSSTEVWKVTVDNATYLDILVKPELQNMIEQLLNCANMSYTTLIQDLQKAIDLENEESDEVAVASFKTSCATTSGMSWTQYQSYDTISSYMDCLGSQYGYIAQLYTIGSSSEGRPLKVIKIGTEGRGQRKQSIWIDGGIHAREWISPAAVSYLLMELVENTNTHSDLLNQYDVYVMPVMNPDGYEYTRESNRMWRKTRSLNRGSSCRGVDPNRNFGYEWGGKGTSQDPCSDIYRGSSAFSEPETQAVRDFITARKRNIKMYLTFHSYGQMVLYPWGYDAVDHRDENELDRVGRIGSRAAGNKYTVGSAAKVLYPAAGGSDDWAMSEGIKFSYTIELPDTGSHGFILPANQIIPVSKEALQAVKSMADSI